MTENTLISGPDLAAVQTRRANLHRACGQLRRLLADAGASAAEGDGDGAKSLAAALAELSHLWERHVQATEAPGGLLAQIVEDSPRLATTVARFRRDHPAIADRIAAAQAALGSTSADQADARQVVTALLADIDRHRRGGGELIHRAYNVDIGLGE